MQIFFVFAQVLKFAKFFAQKYNEGEWRWGISGKWDIDNEYTVNGWSNELLNPGN
jgi:hypothetical protein